MFSYLPCARNNPCSSFEGISFLSRLSTLIVCCHHFNNRSSDSVSCFGEIGSVFFVFILVLLTNLSTEANVFLAFENIQHVLIKCSKRGLSLNSFWAVENSALSQDVGLASVGGFISADNSSLIFSAFSSNLGHSSCGFLKNCGPCDHFSSRSGRIPFVKASAGLCSDLMQLNS